MHREPIDLTVQYDPAIYTLDRYEHRLPEGWQVVANETPGRLQIAGAGLEEQLAPELITLYLTPLADAMFTGNVQASVSIDESPYALAAASDELEAPNAFRLSGNYPNPFNPETTIRYFLPEAAEVHLEVFDVTGRSVAVLVNGASQAAGEYTVTFDAAELPSGIYMYRIEAGNFQQTRKMTLLK